MQRDRRRRRDAGERQAPEPHAPNRGTLLLPVLVAVALNIPSLGLGYFWDDFYFLTGKGHGSVWAYLLPDAHAAFYRPVPLGIYFKVLRLLDPVNGLLGHVLNLAALAGVVVLLVTLVTRLQGRRAGLFAGLAFASYGAVPGLVAWTSGSQDLFAILFVAAAFLLRHRGKNLAALACAAAGLLCKEPALAAFPVLMFWDQIVGRPAVRPRFQVFGYAAVVIAWVLVHPGIHLLAGSGFKSGSTQYVGVEHPERWGLYLARYLMTLVNLPPPGLVTSWWEDRAPYGFAALTLLGVGLWYLDARRAPSPKAGSPSLARMGLLAALFALPSVVMPTILVRHWSPYFACIPALGVAMFVGAVLAKQGRLVATAALGAFLVLGIWCRGTRAEREWVLAEPAMVEASNAVREVRANFRRVLPSPAKGSEVVASVGTRGIRGIQSALVDGQALSLWYRDPTLRTIAMRERRPGATSETLVRVTNELDVIVIDPDPLRVRSASGTTPGLAEIDPPLNYYARVVAAGGETDRAVRVMRGLDSVESGDLGLYNRRLIASMLLAADRRAEAESIVAATPPFPRDVALKLVLRLQADASPSERLDTAAFEAFGLSADDPSTLRWIMRELRTEGSIAQAAWFAQKVERLSPGDGEGAEVLREAARLGIAPQREHAPRLAAARTEGM